MTFVDLARFRQANVSGGKYAIISKYQAVIVCKVATFNHQSRLLAKKAHTITIPCKNNFKEDNMWETDIQKVASKPSKPIEICM